MISKMMLRNLKSVWKVLFLLSASAGGLSQARPPSLTSSDLWDADHVPFSFEYDGKQSAQLLTIWQTSHKVTAAPGGSIARYEYVDPASKLKVIAEVRRYTDFPDAVDWVLRLRNDGAADTPIIENLLPLGPSRLPQAIASFAMLGAVTPPHRISSRWKSISALAKATA
jgi:hypothetical protein